MTCRTAINQSSPEASVLKKKTYIIHKDDPRNESIRSNALNYIRMLPLTRSIEIIIQPYDAKRTLPQNSFSHAIYTEISQHKGDETPMEIKGYCKLHFGLPILANSENRQVAERYSQLMDTLEPLSYEYQLKLMQTIPVTSVMTKKQKTTYTEQILNHFSVPLEATA